MIKNSKGKKEIKPGRDYIGVGGGILILNENKEVLLLKRTGKTQRIKMVQFE